PGRGLAAASASLARIATLPKEFAARHASRDEPRARSLAGPRAQDANDDALARAALAFPLSPSGRIAARVLGDRAIERGDAAEAAWRLSAALDRSNADADIAFRLRASEILSGLSFSGPDPDPKTPVVFLGELSLPGRALARLPLPSKASEPFEPGARRFGTMLPTPAIPPSFRERYESRGLPKPLPFFPVLAASRLWVQTAGALYAIEPATGRISWRQPDEPKADPWRALRGADLRPAAEGARVAAVRDQDLWVFDALTGRVVLRARDVKPARELLEDAIAISSPLLADGRIYVGLARPRGDAEHVLACLSARTGEVLWSTRLATSGPFRHLGEAFVPSPPVLSGGRVYLLTNAGAIGCADARTGRALWCATYKSVPDGAKRREVIENRRATDPPVASAGRIVALPRDADELCAWNAATGEPLWSVPRERDRSLLGIAGGFLVTAGERVRALDPETGIAKSETILPAPAEAAGALAGESALVPTAAGIVRVSVRDARVLETTTWDGDGPGNLSIAAGLLFVATGDAIHARENWPGTVRRLSGPGSAFERGRLLVRRGATAEGRKALEQARIEASGPDEQAKVESEIRRADLEAGRTALAAGRCLEAAAAFQSALALAEAPESRQRILLNLADALAAAGNAAGSVAALQDALDGPEGETRERAVARMTRRLREAKASAYAPIEAKAAARRKALAKERSPEALLEVARAYPHSSAAREAVLDAARRLLESDRAEDALRMLEEAVALIPGGEADPAIAARRIEAAIQAGIPALARAPLRSLASVPPETRVPWKKGEANAAEAVEAARALLSMRLDDFDFGNAESIREAARTEVMIPNGLREDGAGDRVFVPAEGEPEAPPALFLVREESPGEGASATISRIDLDGGDPVFRREIGPWRGRGILGRDALYLWEGSEVLALDLRTGEPRWKASLQAARPPAEAGAPLRFARVRDRKGGIRALAIVHGVLVAAGEDREAAGIDPAGGRILWRKPLPAGLHPRILRGPGGAAAFLLEDRPVIVGLRAADGAQSFEQRLREGDARLTDAALIPGDRDGAVALLYGSRRLMAAVPGAKGPRFDVELPAFAERILAAPGRIVPVPSAMDAKAPKAQAFDAATGALAWESTIPTLPAARLLVNRTALFILQDAWGNSPARIRAVRLDDGRDRFHVSNSRFDRVASSALVSERHLVLAAPRATEAWVLDARTGKVRRRIEPPRGVPLESARAVEDRLLLSTPRTTLILKSIPEDRASARRIAREEDRRASPGPDADRRLSEAFALEGRPQEALEALRPILARANLPETETDRIRARVQGLRERAITPVFEDPGVPDAARPRARQRTAVYPAVRFAKPPSIDGVLSEAWPEPLSIRLTDQSGLERIHLPGIPPVPWHGPADLSAKIYFAWDDRALYFAVDVDDERHELYAHEDGVWRGDAVLIAFDPEGDGGYGFAGPGRPADVVLTQALMKQLPQPGRQTHIPPGSFAVRRKPDETGTVYESEIPWTYFRNLRGTKGTTLSANFKIMDDDGGGARQGMALSPGLGLHHEKSRFHDGFAPALFGRILLVLDPDEAREPAGR
ncbi:MAG: PQQ-binding-like beta-propeller repeat protein, partial [Planctomycetota bacterium]